jgi:hypothetical protein
MREGGEDLKFEIRNLRFESLTFGGGRVGEREILDSGWQEITDLEWGHETSNHFTTNLERELETSNLG